MALSAARNIFGIHSVAPYNRSNGLPYGILKVLDSSSLSLSGELIDLFGGSSAYQWASEQGQITAEMNLTLGELPDFVFELFLGKAPTLNSAEASGNVSSIVDLYGTSVVAATGLASVAVLAGSEANLKFGKYVVKATSATEITVYCLSDVDFSRGTDETYENDALAVTTALTITTGGNTDVASLGLRFTGGAGVIAFVTGDTATFEVRPINSKSSIVNIGASGDITPEFGAILMAQKRGNGEMFEIDAYRCKASGMPIGFETFAWAKPEVTAKLLFDSTKNGVFGVRAVTPTSV